MMPTNASKTRATAIRLIQAVHAELVEEDELKSAILKEALELMKIADQAEAEAQQK